MVRVPDCRSGCCGFESRLSRHLALRARLAAAAMTLLFSAYSMPLSAQPVRLANGAALDGVAQEATAEGLRVEIRQKGVQLIPWKYLSAGTRFRYLEMPGMTNLLMNTGN